MLGGGSLPRGKGGEGYKVEFPRLELRIISTITHFSRVSDAGMIRGLERREGNFRDMRFNGAKVTNN